MATFDHDSAPASFEWNLQWKNNLSNLIAKLKKFFENAELPVLTVTDGLVVEGDTFMEGALQIEEDLSADDAAFGGEVTVAEDISLGGDLHVDGQILYGPIDLTGVSADYPLVVGQTAKIRVTAQSTPLNVMTTDGVYDLICLFDISTFGADRAITLEINNTTFTGEFSVTRFGASTGFATDEVDTSETTLDAHHLAFGLAGATTMTPWRIDSRLSIFGTRSTLFSDSDGLSSTTRIQSSVRSTRNGSPAHTSLGTLNAGETVTGIVYVHRLA